MTNIQDYAQHLSRLPLSPHTRRNYLLRVKQYVNWLQAVPAASSALSDTVDRDFAVRDYRAFLLQRGFSASTVNSALTAIDSFYLFLGIKGAKTKRQELPKLAPRALDPEELRRLLKAIAQSKSLRNKTVAMLMLHCGLRISEAYALNISDVLLSARKRELIVRCGKNDKRRTVPINKDAAGVLQEYLASDKRTDQEAPLFVSRKGFRLSQPAIDHLIRMFGRDAGVSLSSHSLRHTCLTRLVRAGVDIVTVAEIAGHSRLETTRRYSLPTEEVMIAAMERLNYQAS